MQCFMKSLRFLPESLSWSAPNLQVSIRWALVAATAGDPASRNGTRAASESVRAKVRSMMGAPVSDPDRESRYHDFCLNGWQRASAYGRPRRCKKYHLRRGRQRHYTPVARLKGTRYEISQIDRGRCRAESVGGRGAGFGSIADGPFRLVHAASHGHRQPGRGGRSRDSEAEQR